MNANISTTDRQSIVENCWRDQALWSETASQLKKKLSMWRNVCASAGLLGAFMETLAGTLAGIDESLRFPAAVIALIGAVVLAVVPYLLHTKVSKDRIREWIRARSASETLKEIIFRYLLESPPFGPDAAPGQLIDQCEAVKANIKDLSIYAAAIDPPRKERPNNLNINEYINLRVKDQIENYYRRNGKKKARAAKKLHNFEFGLGILAVALGALAGANTAFKELQFSFLGPWVAVVTTAGAAVTAHLAALRYDHEAIIFSGTADRLSGLLNKYLANPDRMSVISITRFVDDCEHAISTENESWLAKWTEVPATNMSNIP